MTGILVIKLEMKYITNRESEVFLYIYLLFFLFFFLLPAFREVMGA